MGTESDMDKAAGKARGTASRKPDNAVDTTPDVAVGAEADAEAIKADAMKEADALTEQAINDADALKVKAQAEAQKEADALKAASREEAEAIKAKAVEEADAIKAKAEAEAKRITYDADVEAKKFAAEEKSKVAAELANAAKTRAAENNLPDVVPQKPLWSVHSVTRSEVTVVQNETGIFRSISLVNRQWGVNMYQDQDIRAVVIAAKEGPRLIVESSGNNRITVDLTPELAG